MRSYRFARRAFMSGVGGAVGLKILLRNLELSAAGAPSPPRFLMMHWPVGTVRYRFKPATTDANYGPSPILQPFFDAGLNDQMAVFYGLSQRSFQCPGGGGHEAGTPFTTTGANSPGTRRNGGEGDDGVAGGPSFDQIFLEHVPALVAPGPGYANAICDARVDSLETSTQCLSYGYATQSVPSANGGAALTEHVPLLPILSPAQLYTNLFSSFVPGGSNPSTDEAVLRALVSRKSVLDYSLRQLDAVYALAPASERDKLELHADAIRKVEMQISKQIEDGGTPPACTLPERPDDALVGRVGSRFDYEDPSTTTDDKDLHDRIGKAHAAILRAAFQCDLIRVATFQWSPGTNHVSFAGMFPDDTAAIYMHHPASHKIMNTGFVMDALPGGVDGSFVEFLVNVQTWYNARTAEILNEFRLATDAFGGNLFDHTVFPFVTEVSQTTHLPRDPMAGLIFGGKALGMHPSGGQYQNFESNPRSYNDLWMTVAQAYLGANPQNVLAGEKFLENGGTPIEGVWAPPQQQ